MSKEIKCFLGKNNPSAICVNKADYIRLRNKIKETKIKSRNEALQEIKKLIQVIKKLKKENEEYNKLLEWRRYVETNEQRMV